MLVRSPKKGTKQAKIKNIDINSIDTMAMVNPLLEGRTITNLPRRTSLLQRSIFHQTYKWNLDHKQSLTVMLEVVLVAFLSSFACKPGPLNIYPMAIDYMLCLDTCVEIETKDLFDWDKFAARCFQKWLHSNLWKVKQLKRYCHLCIIWCTTLGCKKWVWYLVGLIY